MRLLSLFVGAFLVIAGTQDAQAQRLPGRSPSNIQDMLDRDGCLKGSNTDVQNYYEGIRSISDANRVAGYFCEVQEYCKTEYRGDGNQESPSEKSCRKRMGGCTTSARDRIGSLGSFSGQASTILSKCFSDDKANMDKVRAEGDKTKQQCIEDMRYEDDGEWHSDTATQRDGDQTEQYALPEDESACAPAGQLGNTDYGSAVRAIANCDTSQHGGNLNACVKDSRSGGLVSSVVTGILGQVAALAQSLGRYALDLLIQPENCITCLIILYFVMTLDTVFDLGFQYLSLPVLMIGSLAFAVWMYRKLLAPAAGLSQSMGSRAWPEIFGGFAKYMILLVFLGAVAFSSGSPSTNDGPFQWIYGNIIAPSLSAGAGIGSKLNEAIAFGGGSAASRGLYQWMKDNNYREDVTDTVIEEAAKHNLLPLSSIAKVQQKGTACQGVCRLARNLISLTASINLVASMGLARSIGYMGDAGAAENAIGGILSMVIGVMLGMTFIFFMLTAALQLLDPLFRMMIALALSPLLALAFVFNFSKNAAINGIRTVLYGIAFFMIVGISFAIAIQLITVSFLLDYSGGVRVISMDDFLDRLAQGTDSVDENGHLDIFKPIFSFILAYLAIAVTKFSGKIASMLTDYQAQGGIAEQVQQQASGFSSSMMGVGVQGASMALSGMGALGRGGLGFFSKLLGK